MERRPLQPLFRLCFSPSICRLGVSEDAPLMETQRSQTLALVVETQEQLVFHALPHTLEVVQVATVLPLWPSAKLIHLRPA